MPYSLVLPLCSAVAVIVYYVVVWMQVGLDPELPTIVTRYHPPRQLSPAMLRYIWKENFDDRVFWAGLLSLVSKGLAVLTDSAGAALIRPTAAASHHPRLPREEQVLLKRLLSHRSKGVHLSMLNDDAMLTVSEMAGALRHAALGRWFLENRNYVIAGTLFSIVPVCLAANPRSVDSWVALILYFAVMAPAAFYILLLFARYRDLYRSAREGFSWPILKRALLLLGFFLPCIAALIFGFGLLAVSLGWFVVVMTAAMIGVDLLFLQLMKAPTVEGVRLLAEIEGFREFLHSVERFPMDGAQGPKPQPDVYERYLPYAVALEVEQAWSDKFIALATTVHQPDTELRAHSYYLGMWNGRPVEVVVGRTSNTRY